MSTGLFRPVLGVCLVLSLCTHRPVRAEKQPASPLVDHYGDPLPPGAIARLGTLRLVHLGGLSSVALSPDGKIVASGRSDGKRVALGKLIYHELDGSRHIVADRLQLTTIRLWDADSGKMIREIATPDGPVTCLRFDPKGRFLFGGCGRFLCKWDVVTGKQLWHKDWLPEKIEPFQHHARRFVFVGDRLISFHEGKVECLDKKDEPKACSLHAQLFIRIWDTNSGGLLPSPSAIERTVQAEGHIDTLFHSAALSSDGRYIAVLSSRATPLWRNREKNSDQELWKYTDFRLLIVEWTTGKVCHRLVAHHDLERRRFAFGETVYPDSLTFSGDDTALAVALQGNLVLVPIASGKNRLLAKNLPENVRLAFAGAKQLAVMLPNGKVRVWEITSGKEIVPGPEYGRHFITASKSRFAERDGKSIVLRDVRSGKPVPAFEGHRGTPEAPLAFVSRDRVVSGDHRGICVWETGHWKQIEARYLPEKLYLESDSYDRRFIHLREAISWEKELYVRRQTDPFELREIRTDRLVRRLANVGAPLSSPTFSASGNRLVAEEVAQENSFYHFFDVSTGKALSRIPNSRDLGELSARGSTFAQIEGEKEDQVGVYEVATGERLRTLTPRLRRGKVSKLTKIHFSADERTVLAEAHRKSDDSSSNDTEAEASLILWNVRTGDVLQEIALDQHQEFRCAGIYSMVLSPDSRMVALAWDTSKDIEVWEVASGTRRFVLTGHAGTVASLAFSPDCKYLASGSTDTTILIWDLLRPLPPQRLSPVELSALWQTLTQPDAAKADLIIRRMAAAAGDAVPFLKGHLHPVGPAAERLQQLVRDLDSDEYKLRAEAARALEALGEAALGTLEKAARQKNSPEVQRRLKALIRKAQASARPYGAPERLRQWRALEILERSATPAARALLNDLAAGASGAWLTEEARAALARLDLQGRTAR